MKFTDSTWFMNDSRLSRKSYENKNVNENIDKNVNENIDKIQTWE